MTLTVLSCLPVLFIWDCEAVSGFGFSIVVVCLEFLDLDLSLATLGACVEGEAVVPLIGSSCVASWVMNSSFYHVFHIFSHLL